MADDHPILREGLKGYLSSEGGFSVLGAVGDAQSALVLCRRHAPDVLLLDVEMPGRDALGVMGDVRSASPDTRIVILTAFCRDAIIEVAVRGGAAGYLLKSDPPPAILGSISRVLKGERVYSEAVVARLSHNRGDSRRAREGVTPLSALTLREMEVLRYLGRGWDNNHMARVMHLSKRTVERHIFRLMEAMNSHDRAGLAKYAHDNGLVV